MLKRSRVAGEGNPDKKKRSVDITVHKATCLRQSLGACVAPAWKAAINADIDRIGAIVWLGSRAFHHYLTTQVATGKATLPADDNALARLIKACFTVQCTHTVDTASRREAEFVAWREEWRNTVADRLPPAACVSVGGLSNALQFECAEYTTAFKKHLRQGIAALHARALRVADGLSKRDAESATERRLCGSPYFKGVFHHNAVADPDAPTVTNHHEAVLVLVGCLRAVDAAYLRQELPPSTARRAGTALPVP